MFANSIVVSVAALVVTVGIALAQSESPSATADQADANRAELANRIDTAVEPYLENSDFHGVVAVGRDGQAPLVRAYGMASQELEVPHTKDSVFLIGSVSKQFTAVGILLLEQDGKLETSDPVQKHVPEFKHERVTIEHLLTHTAGAADVYSLEQFGATEGRAGDFDAVIEAIGGAALTQKPGSGFAYSNGGYSVLAAIIERVSKQQYGDFLESRLFKPLKMSSTSDDVSSKAKRHRVSGYDPWGARDLTPAPRMALAFMKGSGSLWSSAEDLLTWNEALHTGKLLSEASYSKLVKDYGASYGYGVSVFKRFDRNVVGHDGRVSGFSSDLARYLDDTVSVVVLGNVQSSCRDQIRRAVAAAVFDIDVKPSKTPRLMSGAGDSKQLGELVGTYPFFPGLTVYVTTSGGRLLARANEGGASELVRTEDGAWFSRMLYTTVRFGRDEEGKVDRLIWGAGENAPAAPKSR